MLRKSLSLELEGFFNFLKINSTNKFTKSAFVQARKKINAKVFKHLSQKLVDEFYTDNEFAVKTWKNFRLLAIDGSRITLPLTKELSQYYGKTKNQTDTSIVQARCSVLYDVENNYVLESSLHSVKGSVPWQFHIYLVANKAI